MNATVITLKVAKRFHELRRRYLGVQVGITLASALTALVLIWLTLAACDYYWEWSLSWRKAGYLAGLGAVAVGFLHRLYVVVRATQQRKFAAQLEHSFDGFGQRIRTVLDTVDGRVSGPDEMLSALGHQTLGRWETLTPSQLIPSRLLMIMGLVAMGVLFIAGTMFIGGGDMRVAMLRSLGQEIPYTTMEVTPGDARLLEGTAVEVSLDLHGRTNRDVVLRYRNLRNIDELAAIENDPESTDEPPSEPQWIESELLPTEPAEGEEADDRNARFAAALGKASHPVEYQFVTSIGTTPIYRLDVQQLIEAERIETSVAPPDYTRLETRAFASSQVTVLQHSQVNVSIQTNHPLRQGRLEIGDKPNRLQPVEITPGDDLANWSFELPSTKSLHWRFTGQGHDGTPMTPVKGRLRVRHDAAPVVRWRDPPDEIRVHTLAELPMRVQVSDDYGINETGIVFQLGGDDEYVLTDWIEEDPENTPTVTTRLQLAEILPLESFALSERDYIAYYAYAVDNRGSGPRRSESDVRYIDIRPLRQFYLEVEQDPNNNGGGRVLVQLDEIIRRERFLINRTRRLLRSSNVDLATQLGTIDRMVESQSELAGLTRFLADFFVARGNDDVEALNQAEAAMLQASDSLAAGSFDLALVQEEDALRALAEARRSLEIALLKNPTPQQQAALRRLARQIRQKLRRERPETEQQIADSLNRIAAEQAQIGRMAARIDRQQQMMSGSSGQSSQPNQSQPQQQSGASGSRPPDESNENPESQGETPSGENSSEPSESESDESNADSEEGESGSDDESESDEGSGDQADQTEQQEMENDGGGSGAEQPTIEEQQDQLYARQVDLLERVDEISEQLAERLADSPLLSSRMEEAEAAMDNLATQARGGQFNRLANDSQDVSELLREMSMQLDTLAAPEPVARVSAMRDMTTSLANMERQLSEQLRPRNQSRSQTGQAGSGQSDADGDTSQAQLARRMQRRTETIEDILAARVDTGDVETSEVNDFLQQFVEDNEFMEQLEETRDAADQLADGSGEGEQEQPESDDRNGGGSDEAFQRAVEYAEAARMLDELYRQLVAPRLERLRDMEQTANRLAQQLGGGGGGDNEQDNPDAQNGIRMLQEELEEQGLEELAELLEDPQELSEERLAELEEMFTTRNGRGALAFDIRSGDYSTRVMLVAAELQDRIQEIVLREISADRDAPVPAQYRDAVDRYFRALAGEAEAMDATVGAGGGQ